MTRLSVVGFGGTPRAWAGERGRRHRPAARTYARCPARWSFRSERRDIGTHAATARAARAGSALPARGCGAHRAARDRRSVHAEVVDVSGHDGGVAWIGEFGNRAVDARRCGVVRPGPGVRHRCLRRGAGFQQARHHRRRGPGVARRRGGDADRGAVRAAAVALPRHLLRDAHARAVDGGLRRAREDRGARRLRRLQHGPAHAVRPEPARCPRGLCDVQRDGHHHRAARAAGASLFRFDARPGEPGDARQRVARRVPRRLGAARDGGELRARCVCRRRRRRAGRHVARPHRPELQLLDDVRRIRLRCHPRRLAKCARGVRGVHRARSRAFVFEFLLSEHLAVGARAVPAVRDPVPAARNRVALVRPRVVQGAGGGK